MLKSSVTQFCFLTALLSVSMTSFAQEPKDEAASGAVAEPAKDAPAHNPPQIVVAASIDEEDNLVLVNFKTIYIGFTGESYNERSLSKTTLKDVSIFAVNGKKLSVDEARKQLAGKHTPILCSSWKTPLPPFYASLFTPETLHFVFPKKSPAWKEIQEPGRPVH